MLDKSGVEIATAQEMIAMGDLAGQPVAARWATYWGAFDALKMAADTQAVLPVDVFCRSVVRLTVTEDH